MVKDCVVLLPCTVNWLSPLTLDLLYCHDLDSGLSLAVIYGPAWLTSFSCGGMGSRQ